ncbi:MAG: U32 family peptidase [bacterium]
MKLHLAANYDSRLVDELEETSVASVYGKMQGDVVGGGRSSYMGQSLSWTELADYIARLKKKGIEFTYLLNSSCLGNREWTRSAQKKIRKLLDRIVEAGAGGVTVSTPYLLKLIKERHPDLHVTVGIYAQVDTLKRVRFWESLGADAITLESFSINRNFTTLRKIRAGAEAELILIANHICLPNCGLQPYHQNCFAHSSDNSGNFFIDYSYLKCNRRRFANPELFISSSWIRPEDIENYEDMGFETFKLLERDLPTSLLLKRVQAYEEGEFNGNLAELFLSHSFGRQKDGLSFWHYLFNLFSVPLKSLLRADKFMKSQGLLHELDECPVQIDSEKIPADFLAHFKDRDCLNSECDRCGYCREIANEAVTITDPEAAGKYADLLADLENGDFWRG